MILTDELCDRLCNAARQKSRQLGIDISFVIADENGLPRAFRRYGDSLVLSITLVPGNAYTSAITRTTTKELAEAAAEKAPLMGIQTCDPRITLVAGGYPLFVDGRIVGGIDVGGGYGGTGLPDCGGSHEGFRRISKINPSLLRVCKNLSYYIPRAMAEMRALHRKEPEAEGNPELLLYAC